MAQLGLIQFSTDRAFYTALKMHVYNTLNETVLKAVMDGNTMPVEGKVNIQIGRFTSRKTNYLFVPDSNHPSSSSEFFGFTSHKVREKLTQFEEEGMVELVGRGLRDAQTYEWREPLRKWELCSFLRFKAVTESDLSLSLELHRVFESFADDPFTLQDFTEMYRAVHEAEYGKSRWGKRKFEKIGQSYAYENYLKQRLKLMHKQKLVSFEKADASFQLTPRAVDAAQHVQLFAEGPGYVASWNMCHTCPLNQMCNQFAVTDLVLEQLQNDHVPGTNGHGPNGAPTGPMTQGSNGAHGEPLPE